MVGNGKKDIEWLLVFVDLRVQVVELVLHQTSLNNPGRPGEPSVFSIHA